MTDELVWFDGYHGGTMGMWKKLIGGISLYATNKHNIIWYVAVGVSKNIAPLERNGYALLGKMVAYSQTTQIIMMMGVYSTIPREGFKILCTFKIACHVGSQPEGFHQTRGFSEVSGLFVSLFPSWKGPIPDPKVGSDHVNVSVWKSDIRYEPKWLFRQGIYRKVDSPQCVFRSTVFFQTGSYLRRC